MKYFLIKLAAVVVIVCLTPLELYRNMKLALSYYWGWVRIEWASATVERFEEIKQQTNR